MRGSSNRVAALTVWVVALSVAIAVVGSSTLLFPGPDIGDRPTPPSGRDIVARFVAPFFAPPPAQEREAAPAPAVEAPAPAVTAPLPLVAIPAGLAAERPVRSRGTTVRPSSDQSPLGARADKGKGKTKHGANARGKVKADKPPHGNAVAGAKSEGHGQGHLKSTPPRGPKQPHVQPAQGHGKSKGRARGHARAGR